MNARSFVGAGALLVAALGCRDETQSPTEPGFASPQAAPELAVSSNTWITQADMPNSARWEAATVVVPNAAGQSILYVIGGRTITGSSLSRVQAYNAATNMWTWKAPLPIPLKQTNGAGVINRKVYLSGGTVAGKGYNYELYVYDPARNAWSRRPNPVPTAGLNGFTGVIDNKLYVVTSCWDFDWCGSPNKWLLRYDPLTDTWTELATPPINIHHLNRLIGGTIGKKIYVGYPGSRILGVYDPLTNSWTQRTTTLGIRNGAASATHGAKLYMIGGYRLNPDGTSTEVRTNSVYDPATNLWTNRAPMPALRSGMTAARVVVNGQSRIELVGGPPPGNNLQYIP
jgi:N-acetylneuraminic acid mutarotase